LREELMAVTDETEGCTRCFAPTLPKWAKSMRASFDLDFNTPEEYQIARQRYGLGS
jgi:hypothetical protein